MQIVSELLVANEADARAYVVAWDEESALEGDDDWYDEGQEGAESRVDELPGEEGENPGPLDAAREALAGHDQRKGLDAAAMTALATLLAAAPAPPAAATASASASASAATATAATMLKRLAHDGPRTLYRLAPPFVAALASLEAGDVDAVAARWATKGRFATTPENAAEVLRSLQRLAAQARHDGLGLFQLVLA
jgi:hypothetical protein